VRFIDQYRSYVVNYNLGKDLVAAHVESRGRRAGPGQAMGRRSSACCRLRACRPGS
jgi:hypothetical protein